MNVEDFILLYLTDPGRGRGEGPNFPLAWFGFEQKSLIQSLYVSS